MYVLQLFNQYRSLFNGEEQVVRRTASLLEQHGVRTRLIERSSRDIPDTLRAKASAFWNGIYSHDEYRKMKALLRDDRPDIVHAHNLYPLFSPSVLAACHEEQVPVVLTLHNQMLTCPKSDHLLRGQICERCTGGNEVQCLVNNCRDNWLESLGYAWRSWSARRHGWFRNNVTTFIALTEFARLRLSQNGFDGNHIEVLHNSVSIAATPADPALGSCVVFAGRLSAEKGIPTLLHAASQLPECRFVVAGSGPLMESCREQATDNVQFVGQLDRAELAKLYRRARCVVLPSTCFEMCPLTVLEAMSHGVPVVASRIGGIPELVADEQTGLLFSPGNTADLVNQLQRVISDKSLCRQLGAAGYDRARDLFCEDDYFSRLLGIYQRAIDRVVSSASAGPNFRLPVLAGDNRGVS